MKGLRWLAFANVFVAADECSIGSVVADCSLANPEDSVSAYYCTDRYLWEWSEDASEMLIRRSDSSAVYIPDTVLDKSTFVLMGGCAQDFQSTYSFCETLTDSVHFYEPDTDEWTPSTPMPTERLRFGAINIGSHIFVFGGRNVVDDLLCQVDIFNVVDETWTTLPEKYDWQECLSDFGIFTSNESIYLVGGYDQIYNTYSTTLKVDIEYDTAGTPVALTYSEMALMNQGRGDHACWSDSTSEAYCMGGFNFDYSLLAPLTSVEKYDIATNTWTNMADMNFGRGDFVMGYLNDRLTVVGGETFDETRGYNVGVTYMEWYSIEDDCWTTSASAFELPYPLFRFSGAVDPTSSRLYVFGGQLESNGYQWSIEKSVIWYQERIVTDIYATIITIINGLFHW